MKITFDDDCWNTEQKENEDIAHYLLRTTKALSEKADRCVAIYPTETAWRIVSYFNKPMRYHSCNGNPYYRVDVDEDYFCLSLEQGTDSGDLYTDVYIDYRDTTHFAKIGTITL